MLIKRLVPQTSKCVCINVCAATIFKPVRIIVSFGLACVRINETLQQVQLIKTVSKFDYKSKLCITAIIFFFFLLNFYIKVYKLGVKKTSVVACYFIIIRIIIMIYLSITFVVNINVFTF